jgi:hypothetical protein
MTTTGDIPFALSFELWWYVDLLEELCIWSFKVIYLFNLQ